MSPEAKASAAALARLLAEIGEDRDGLAKRIGDAREAERRMGETPEDPGALALAGVALHGYYTGLEMIFERIARQLDGSLPVGDRWHRELLSQMTAEIPGIRPSVVDRTCLPDLTALLGFRHFFRHAYAVTFDHAQLAAELARLLRVTSSIDDALDRFTAFVAAVMHRIASE